MTFIFQIRTVHCTHYIGSSIGITREVFRAFRWAIDLVVACAFIINSIRTKMYVHRTHSGANASTTCALCGGNDVCISFTSMLKRVAFHRCILVCVYTYGSECVWVDPFWGVWMRYVDELRSMDDAIKHGFLNATIVWPGLHFRCACKWFNMCVCTQVCVYVIDSWMSIAHCHAKFSIRPF